MDTRRTSTILASGALILACSGKALDVGSNQNPGTVAGNGGAGGAGGSGGAPGPGANAVLPTWPDPGSCATDSDLPMAGVWEGEAFADDPSFAVPDHLKRFRVTLGGSTESGACGSVVYGEGVPPPPATDPDARYPPAGSGFMEPDQGGFGARPGMWGPMPGVPYTMLDTTIEESRVRFTVGLSELWSGWCGIQTPVSTPDGYQCVPRLSGGDSLIENGTCVIVPLGGREEPVECLKWELCTTAHACACNAQGCVASREQYTLAGADLYFAGNEAWGYNGYNYVTLHRIE